MAAAALHSNHSRWTLKQHKHHCQTPSPMAAEQLSPTIWTATPSNGLGYAKGTVTTSIKLQFSKPPHSSMISNGYGLSKPIKKGVGRTARRPNPVQRKARKPAIFHTEDLFFSSQGENQAAVVFKIEWQFQKNQSLFLSHRGRRAEVFLLFWQIYHCQLFFHMRVMNYKAWRRKLRCRFPQLRFEQLFEDNSLPLSLFILYYFLCIWSPKPDEGFV